MNSYALICPETRESVLIDPGAEPDTLLATLENSTPKAIILTHTHPDHVGALDEMRSRLQVPLLAHPGPHFNEMSLEKERELVQGDVVQVGDHALHVYHTPGHILDQISLSIVDDERIIVGDTLFEGGPGKTWSPQQFQTSLQILRNVVLQWPDESLCYPGHGPSFRLGDLRPKIEAFLAKEHGNFYGDATWDM
jgi:glyoxylase-like metal-dependent hydrolase (beta-lactamase superfamily II)